ncbi:GNAT family N-acetyltransferase [Planctomicrobium sp. SH668]|uniref:GNAT family N-acetyltransferase n=1 Tax=Planctomicrobium sp. SH668 TaxID=3448126 RepID=UPI003F5B1669
MSDSSPVLATNRLVLRKLVVGDLDFVAELRGDPEVMKFYPKVLDRSESLLFIEKQLQRYAQDGFALWLVLDRESQLPRGLVGIVRQLVEDRELIEVGWMIQRESWRQGFAKEAASACLEWAFRRLDVDRIFALIRPENLPSIAVAKSLQMQVEAKLVNHFGFRHHAFYVTRENWESRSQAAD